MKVVWGLILSLVMVASASAQTVTIGMFAATATNPNTAMPLSEVTYANPICDQPIDAEVPGLVNPNEGAIDDPARAGRECRMNIASQVSALAPGSGYKAAARIGNGSYGAFSNAFAVAAQATHPCDATPTSPTSMIAGQSLTFGWCHTGSDTTGTSSVTGWRVYRNGTLLSGVTVTAGATVNALGLRLYTITRTESVPGNVSFEVAAVNAVGEGARSPAISINVQPAPTVPAAPQRIRISVP